MDANRRGKLLAGPFCAAFIRESCREARRENDVALAPVQESQRDAGKLAFPYKDYSREELSMARIVSGLYC